MLVYDVTKRESFDNLAMWLEEIGKHSPIDVKLLLVGNKCDLVEERVIR